ncbi:hypothetical protein [Ramlibacter rhizophilus]|uniref:Uncharacterized protein n=1 Tax=Ramlibacter rhizophilus TaxID=1781167 RepID=A0A4Z0BSM3_9BURK|nr:hypothetical protein [Ramlibacter rhizophilus]TFZ01430.1 hypothetical protein EZ242_08620 [Ramlibacter rhizophilus]
MTLSRYQALRVLLAALLLAWACGLAVAAVRLNAWQEELTRVLIQLRSDELLRASVRQRDQVHPQWYRKRALALLSAVERLRADTSWSLVMPGSWRWIDDLEERAAATVDRAFGHVVVETIRRELENRTATITGVPLDPGSGMLQASADCRAAALPTAAQGRVAALGDLPEFAAAAQQLEAIRQLDRAVDSLVALQDSRSARPDDMRLLVRYTLGAELSGSASRSISMFLSQASLPGPELEALRERLGAAVRCSATKSMVALHARWFAGNELLGAEDELSRLAPAVLFESSSRIGLGPSAARMASAAQAIGRQQAVLAQDPHAWLRSPVPPLGADYERLLSHMGEVALLGPRGVEQVRADAESQHAQLRRRAEQLARASGGLRWDEADRRFTLAPERVRLREGLLRLLDLRLMREAPVEIWQPASLRADLQPWLEDIAATVRERYRFMRDGAALFPRSMRPQLVRYVDDRLAQYLFERASRMILGELEASPAGSYNVVQHVLQRIALVEYAVLDGGSSTLAARLRQRLERDILAPLATTQPPVPLAPLAPSTLPGWSVTPGFVN